jgi:hypothetical protein
MISRYFFQTAAAAFSAVGRTSLAARIRTLGAPLPEPTVTFLTVHGVAVMPFPGDHNKMLAKLAALPPVTADFSTPEGAILCLEAAEASRDLESASACQDFEMWSKVWLRERMDYREEQQKVIAPELAESMEEWFRRQVLPSPQLLGVEPSFFIKRTPFGDGLIDVTEVSVKRSNGSMFWQHVLVSKTPAGWRVVGPLFRSATGWRLSAPVRRNSGPG